MRSTAIPPPTAPLTDGVIRVRTRRADDIAAVAEASADPMTQRWLGDGPMDVIERRTSLARAEEALRSGRSAPLLIADAVTDAPLGVVNLQFRSDELATIAYSVFPVARGRGLAARAVALVCEWARGLDVHEVRLEIDPTNTASLRVAGKCAFDPLDEITDDGKAVFARRLARAVSRRSAP
ncbi:MAG TPA: GNAT family N-acetyltransferase [Jatrophihabitans sp.]|jgi:RimJ/RimL family protein N-acetyltransferase|uniref:GNAT family N-acetyltransferase n=1 Tax=Jatrophihabitans sp. TaxID=1932789 RepID=UPI002DF782D8|nr:GNAT family N-acetyltransferase [Jatrophihabitans sp.]